MATSFSKSSSGWLALAIAFVIGHPEAHAQPCATPTPACHLENGKDLLTSDPKRAAEELLASYKLDERTDTLVLYATALQLDHRYALALETWKRVIVFRDSELDAARDTARTATGRKRAAARAAEARIQKQSEQAAEAIIKLWPSVGRVRIRLAAGQQLAVSRDGAEVDVSQDVLVNAGKDELVFTRKDGSVERVVVQVAAGALANVDAPPDQVAKPDPKPPRSRVPEAPEKPERPSVPVGASAPDHPEDQVAPVAASTPARATERFVDEPRSLTMSRVGLGLVAGAVVAGGVAGGLGYLASRDYDSARTAGCSSDGRCPFGPAADLGAALQRSRAARADHRDRRRSAGGDRSDAVARRPRQDAARGHRHRAARRPLVHRDLGEVLAMRALVFLVLASCTHDIAVFDRVDVPTARDLDILYVFDTSPGRGTYDQLASQLGVLQAQLAGVDGQLPSLHVGVVTTDLGTRGRLDAKPGPPIGHCAGEGDAGKLVTFQAGLTFGRFLEDLPGPGDTRIRNFDPALVTELAQLTNPAPGTANTGCEFPQPLEAMRRALDPATNPDFIRPGAALSIVFLTDHDDCSLARTAMLDPFDTSLGPSLAFRCTEQGVICDPDDPRKPGTHTSCRPREGSPFVVNVSDYQTFLAQYKPDPDDVVVSAVAGPRSSFEVRDAGAPALAPSCQGPGGDATPAVRIGALVDRFGGALIDGCTQDAAYQQIAAPLANRRRSCFPDLRRSDGEDCTVTEVAGGVETELARCADGNPPPCWSTYTDAAGCPGGDHIGIAITRGATAAPAGSHIQATCFAK